MLPHIKSKFHQSRQAGTSMVVDVASTRMGVCVACSLSVTAPGSSTPKAPFCTTAPGELAIELWCAPRSELPSIRIFRIVGARMAHPTPPRSVLDCPWRLGGAFATCLSAGRVRASSNGHYFFHIQESGTNDITTCTSPATEAARQRLHFQSVMLWPENKCYGAS